MAAKHPTTKRWKAIEGWPYEASDHGQVRNRRGNMLADRGAVNGYPRIMLCRSASEHKDFYIHFLVCEAFVGPKPFPGAEVDHINDVRADNHYKNLQWLTSAQNKEGRDFAKGNRNGNTKLTVSQVRFIRSLPFRSKQDSELAARFSVSRETIRDVRLGKYWRHVDD